MTHVAVDAAEELRGEGMRVYFEGVKAIDGVDVVLRHGELLGLIGPNGAGKTTLVNAVSGFQRPTAGKVYLGDEDVTGLTPQALGRKGLARTFQGVRVFGNLTAVQNVALGALGVGASRKEARKLAWDFLERMHLADKADQPASALPYGDERRVGFLRALAMSPSFILLDEPAAGLNEAESDEIVRLIGEIREDFGCGVLVIEHDMRVIMQLCDRIQVLDYGKTISMGSPSEIRADPGVIAAYLGTRDESDTPRESRPIEVSRSTPGKEVSRSLLAIQDLRVSYGRIAALRGVDLEVREGEIVGVIGPNGAGKSSMLSAIAGAVPVASGHISFDGEFLARQRPERIVRLGISLVPEGRRIFGRLTVGENLQIGATARADRAEVRADRERVLDLFPILREYFDSPAGKLSGGEQQMLAIARALLSGPRLLLLDEPSLGLAPIVIDRVFEALEGLRASGVTMLLVEQNAARTVELADRIYVLRTGTIELEGKPEELVRDASFEESFLGL